MEDFESWKNNHIQFIKAALNNVSTNQKLYYIKNCGKINYNFNLFKNLKNEKLDLLKDITIKLDCLNKNELLFNYYQNIIKHSNISNENESIATLINLYSLLKKISNLLFQPNKINKIIKFNNNNKILNEWNEFLFLENGGKWYEFNKQTIKEEDNDLLHDTIVEIKKSKKIYMTSYGTIINSDIFVIPQGVTIKFRGIFGTSSSFSYFQIYNYIIHQIEREKEKKGSIDEYFSKLQEHLEDGIIYMMKNGYEDQYIDLYEDIINNANKNEKYSTFNSYSLFPEIHFKYDNKRSPSFYIMTKTRWDYEKVLVLEDFYLSDFIQNLKNRGVKKFTLYLNNCGNYNIEKEYGYPYWVGSECMGNLSHTINNINKTDIRIIHKVYYPDVVQINYGRDSSINYENTKFKIDDFLTLEKQLSSINFKTFKYNFLRLFPKIEAEDLHETFNDILKEITTNSMVDRDKFNLHFYTSELLGDFLDQNPENIDEYINYIRIFYYLFRAHLEQWNPTKVFLISPSDYSIFSLYNNNNKENSFGSEQELNLEDIKLTESVILEYYFDSKLKNNFGLEGLVPCIIFLLYNSLSNCELIVNKNKNRVFVLSNIINQKISEPQLREFLLFLRDLHKNRREDICKNFDGFLKLKKIYKYK